MPETEKIVSKELEIVGLIPTELAISRSIARGSMKLVAQEIIELRTMTGYYDNQDRHCRLF